MLKISALSRKLGQHLDWVCWGFPSTPLGQIGLTGLISSCSLAIATAVTALEVEISPTIPELGDTGESPRITSQLCACVSLQKE